MIPYSRHFPLQQRFCPYSIVFFRHLGRKCLPGHVNWSKLHEKNRTNWKNTRKTRLKRTQESARNSTQKRAQNQKYMKKD